jgi:iron complex transport system ATP-binding protein
VSARATGPAPSGVRTGVGVRRLEASDVHLASLPGRRPRLVGVAFSLVAGSVSALVGPNGAGKSSLLACLAGLERPSRGEIRLDGAPLIGMGRRELARAVAFVGPWSAPDVDLTVEEVVRLGRLAHRTSVWQDPARAGAAAVARALATAELESLAAVPLRALSSGERQRVRLATALAQDSPFLLLDEPTSALDPGHARRVLELARDLAREGRGVALALHDLTAAGQYADDVTLLADGRVVAVGEPWQVLRAEVLSRAYRTPLEVFPHPQSGRPVVVPAFAAARDASSGPLG